MQDLISGAYPFGSFDQMQMYTLLEYTSLHGIARKSNSHKTSNNLSSELVVIADCSGSCSGSLFGSNLR